ncbi:MAG: crossover junction endodeoxyribonuclease RuvC, partial [Chitinophagaceae bacterium]
MDQVSQAKSKGPISQLLNFLLILPSRIAVNITAPLQNQSKIILGIDPGTVIMGYSVLAVSGNTLKVLELDALKLPVKEDSYVRLQLIHQKVTELVRLHKPHTFAIEAPFFGKNVQSMLKLGRAQGVAIAAAMSGGIPVTEYSPKRVKQAITGNGNADKEQVWQMLHRIVH